MKIFNTKASVKFTLYLSNILVFIIIKKYFKINKKVSESKAKDLFIITKSLIRTKWRHIAY